MTRMAEDQHSSPGGAAGRPLATARHLKRTLQVCLSWPLSALLPERFWWPLALRLAWLKVALHLGKTNRRFERLAMIFGPRLPDNRYRRIVTESFAHDYVAYMQRFREHGSRSATPSVTVRGREHLDDALAGGRGVVLWVARFVYSDLLTKKGLHRAGLSVHHVSRPSHGFTGSRLAERFLDPLWLGPEERYLAERIVITNEASTAAARRMRRVLKDNGIISITIGHVGRQWCFAPFLCTRARQATGPANLASNAGAPLLPVHTVRNAAGDYEVDIGAALAAPSAGPREARFEAMAREMMQRTEQFALAAPAQFMFWRGRYDPPVVDMAGSDPCWSPDSDHGHAEPSRQS